MSSKKRKARLKLWVGTIRDEVLVYDPAAQHCVQEHVKLWNLSTGEMIPYIKKIAREKIHALHDPDKVLLTKHSYLKWRKQQRVKRHAHCLASQDSLDDGMNRDKQITTEPAVDMALEISVDEIEIPPFLRLPKNGTRESTEFAIQRIDVRIAKLAKLGLRPHPTMLGYRAELVAQLESNGPYKLRYASGWF